MVCAHVYGLWMEDDLLAWMECAVPSSYLITRPLEAFDGYRFRERRDRPLCHLMVRQQTWQELEKVRLVSRSRWFADVGIA